MNEPETASPVECPSCRGPMPDAGQNWTHPVCSTCLFAATIVDERSATTRSTRKPSSVVPPGSSPTEAPESVRLPADLKIGKFTIIEKIGTGGFGDVFRARQSEPVVREVALKVLKPGMDSREIVGRFESERQTLALMEHPNIARVLDGGETPAGHPYFVMELVRGVPITQYCDDKKLSIRQRLEVFRQVCAGVQHAHQKGIIHRDLKPSNILVEETDGIPLPKVIDFGVSKAVTGGFEEWTGFTQAGQVIGTPQYMSPEQAISDEGGIDTRSDIFSLGVILYELLTGEPPITAREFREAGLIAMAELLQEKTPPHPSSRVSTVAEARLQASFRGLDPSSLRKLLRQDLDWIVMKSLEKERERRYDSATAFSDDIGRYLKHEAVKASPPSRVYALKKFARRQRVPLLAGVAVFAALILGAWVSVWQAIRATEESERARRAESESSLQRDAANAVNLISTEPNKALEIMQRVTAESELLFGKLSPPVTNALVEVLDRARETTRLDMNQEAIAASIEGSKSAILTKTAAYVYDLVQGRLSSTIKVHIPELGSPTAVALFPAGEKLCCGYSNGEIVVYSVTTGVQERRWTVSAGVALVAAKVGSVPIEADGNLSQIVTLDADGGLSRWTTDGQAKGERIVLSGTATTEFLAADAALERLLVGGTFAGEPYFWRVVWPSGEDPVADKITLPRELSALAIRADGERILTGHQDGTLQLYDPSGTPLGGIILAHRSPVSQVTFVEGDDSIASIALDGEARVWGYSGESRSPPLVNPAGIQKAMGSFGAGRYLCAITIGADLRIWDQRGTEARAPITVNSIVQDIIFPRTQPEEMLICSDDGSIKALDWKHPDQVRREFSVGPRPVLQMCLNAEETILAAVSRKSPSLTLLDYPALTLRSTITVPGSWLIAIAFDGEDLIGFESSGALLRIRPETEEISRIASPQPNEFANVAIEMLREPVGSFTHLMTGAFFGSSRAVLVSGDGVWSPLVNRPGFINMACEVPGGVVVGFHDLICYGRRRGNIIDFAQDSLLNTVVPGKPVESIACDPENRTLGALTLGGQLRFFDLMGQPLSPILQLDPIGGELIAAHPRESVFVSSGHSRKLRFWGSQAYAWEAMLAERIAPTLVMPGDAERSSPPTASRASLSDPLSLSGNAAGNRDAIRVMEAGFTMGTDPSWEAASPLAIAGINQLIIQSLGERIKRARLVRIFFGEGRSQQTSFFDSNMMVVMEVPEFTQPEAVAERFGNLIKTFNDAFSKRFSSVLQTNPETMAIRWDETLGAAHFQTEVDFRGNRQGFFDAWWKPTRGDTVVVAVLSSHEVAANDPSATEANRARQERFRESVSAQVKGIILHEDTRPTEAQLDTVRPALAASQVVLIEKLIDLEFVDYTRSVEAFRAREGASPESRLPLLDEALAIVETALAAASEPSRHALWQLRKASLLSDRSAILRYLGRADEAIQISEQAVALSRPEAVGDIYNVDIHRNALGRLAECYRLTGHWEKARDTLELGVSAYRDFAFQKGQTYPKGFFAGMLTSLSDHYVSRGQPEDLVAAQSLIDEGITLANRLRDDPALEIEARVIATQCARSQAKLARKRGDDAAAVVALRACLVDSRVVIQSRPTDSNHPRIFLQDLIALAPSLDRIGEHEQAAAVWSDVFPLAHRWIEHFGDTQKLHLKYLIRDVFLDRNYLNQLQARGDVTAVEASYAVALEAYAKLPPTIRNDPQYADLHPQLILHWVSWKSKDLAAPSSDYVPRLREALATCRPFLNHSDPEVRLRFLKIYSGASLNHMKRNLDVIKASDEDRLTWDLEVIADLPDPPDEPSPEGLAFSDLTWVMNEAADLLHRRGDSEQALAIALRLKTWRRHTVLSQPDHVGLQSNLADALRREIDLRRYLGHDLSLIEPLITESIQLMEQVRQSKQSAVGDICRHGLVLHSSSRVFEQVPERGSDAVDLARQASRVFAEDLDKRPGDLNSRLHLAECLKFIAQRQIDSKPDEARQAALRSAELYRGIIAESEALRQSQVDNFRALLTLLRDRADPKGAPGYDDELKGL